MRLENKVAIVTGGASGYGAGIVERFAEEGARVVVADLNEAGAQETASRVSADVNKTVVPYVCDVADSSQVKKMVESVNADFGQLDVMVNNAGLGQRPVATDATPDDIFNQLMNVNVRGVHYCCAHAVPIFRAQGGGTIVNTSSAIALTPRPMLAAYAASKGAVSAYTQSLALELATENIRVNALCPVAGDTPMLAEFMGGAESEEARSRFVSSVPMRRLSTPLDVANSAVFLASDEAALLTGVLLPVDGGRSI